MTLSLLSVTSFNIIDIILSIISILIGLPTFISIIIYIIRMLNKQRFYKIFFSTVTNNKDKKSWDRYRFKHYIKHSFSIGKTLENIDYKNFIKIINNTKIIILTGSAGIGKSLLMQRLAVKFRPKIRKDNSEQLLQDYGILFYKLNGQFKINDIINHVEEKVKSSSIAYSLYLDGLDEISDLSTSKGSDILNKLIIKLLNSELQNCTRIFISLRPEILDNGYNIKSSINNYNIEVFNIRNFTEKQILSMYRNENKKNITKTKFNIRRQNLKKLKIVIKQNPNSVFSYPLILTWAYDILSDYNIDELENISWYDALGKVIDKELEREYAIYKISKGIYIGTTDYSLEQFILDSKKFLRDIALYMASNRTQRVTKDIVISNTIAANYIYKENELTGYTFLAHRLLRYTESTEDSNAEPYYEFLHNTIYWRILAEALLDSEIPQDKRSDLIINFTEKYSTPLLKYCQQGLWSLQKRTDKPLFMYREYTAYMQAIKTKVINCKINDNSIPLEIILSCFYDMKELTFDYNIRFNCDKISEFVKDRTLNLSNTTITDLNILDKFSYKSFDSLNCSNSNIINAKIPNYIKEIGANSLMVYDEINKKYFLKNKPIGFAYCRHLRNITIPDSLTYIGDAAFVGCSSLTSITIPDSVTYIGNIAFGDCSGLTNISIPDSVTYIGKIAFGDCSSLTSITIPDSVTNIDNLAFVGCSCLTNITIPNSLTKISGWLFQNCSSIKNITIPDSITCIDSHSFIGCSSLNNITIPESVAKLSLSSLFNDNKESTLKVNYNGTVQKWNEIEIEIDTDIDLQNTNKIEIVCKDGIISIN